MRRQYDLSDCRIGDRGRIFANALWHDDPKDPRDTLTIDVELQNEGTNLSFTIFHEGSGETYSFRSK